MSWQGVDRSGVVITGYEVDFQHADGTATTADGQVNNQMFTASGLQPFTNYTFRVAGVNSEGRGPFTDPITLLTRGESNEHACFHYHRMIRNCQ